MNLAQNWHWTAISSCDIAPLRFSRTEKGERSSWVSDSALGSLARLVNRQIYPTQRPHVSVGWTPRRDLSGLGTLNQMTKQSVSHVLNVLMELTWQGQRRKHGVLWVLTVTTQIATNALATPLPPHHILTWRKGCDHDAAFARTNEAVWLFESGIFITFLFIQLSQLLQLYAPPPPPPPPQYWRSYQINVMNCIIFFYICAWNKHVRLRKRPITNPIFFTSMTSCSSSQDQSYQKRSYPLEMTSNGTHYEWKPLRLKET